MVITRPEWPDSGIAARKFLIGQAEVNILSGEYPQKVEGMIGLWEQYGDDKAILDISLDLADKGK